MSPLDAGNRQAAVEPTSATRSHAERLALGSQDTWKESSGFDDLLDAMVGRLESGEELWAVYPYGDLEERWGPVALLTVTSRRVMIHTGAMRRKVHEWRPEDLVRAEAKTGGWLSTDKLILYPLDGGKREVAMTKRDQLVAVFGAIERLLDGGRVEA